MILDEIQTYLTEKEEVDVSPEEGDTETSKPAVIEKPVKEKPKKKPTDNKPNQADAWDNISDLLANIAAMLEFIGRRKNLLANGLTKNLIKDINDLLNKLNRAGNSELSDVDAENLVKASVFVSKAKKTVDGLERKVKKEIGEE